MGPGVQWDMVKQTGPCSDRPSQMVALSHELCDLCRTGHLFDASILYL